MRVLEAVSMFSHQTRGVLTLCSFRRQASRRLFAPLRLFQAMLHLLTEHTNIQTHTHINKYRKQMPLLRTSFAAIHQTCRLTCRALRRYPTPSDAVTRETFQRIFVFFFPLLHSYPFRRRPSIMFRCFSTPRPNPIKRPRVAEPCVVFGYKKCASSLRSTRLH